jgi:hypothetical protein
MKNISDQDWEIINNIFRSEIERIIIMKIKITKEIIINNLKISIKKKIIMIIK